MSSLSDFSGPWNNYHSKTLINQLDLPSQLFVSTSSSRLYVIHNRNLPCDTSNLILNPDMTTPFILRRTCYRILLNKINDIGSEHWGRTTILAEIEKSAHFVLLRVLKNTGYNLRDKETKKVDKTTFKPTI